MSVNVVLPIWKTTRDKFLQKVKDIPAEQLAWKLEGPTIGELIFHTAEVEFMFGEWYFNKEIPANKPVANTTDKEGLINLLQASDLFIVDAMHKLPATSWSETVETKMGSSTPIEAISRLLYHAGIHAGQITTIQKNNKAN